MSQSTEENAPNGSKRTTDDLRQRPTKSKRSRYVMKAWYVLIYTCPLPLSPSHGGSTSNAHGNQQRMQAAKGQMRWRGTLRAVQRPTHRMHLPSSFSQQQLAGLGVGSNLLCRCIEIDTYSSLAASLNAWVRKCAACGKTWTE